MTKQLKQQNSAGIQLANTSSKEMEVFNAYTSEKKLKDFKTKEDLLIMNSLLIRWTKYIGISTPEPSELNMLSNFLRENFKTFSTYDINECVTMLAVGKLETDAEHYGKLSPIYLSKVLKAYQSYRSEVVHKVRQKIEEKNRLELPKPTEGERLNTFKILLKQSKETIDKQEPFIDFGEVIYNFIKKNKLVFMPDLKDEALAYGREKYSEKVRHDAFIAIARGVGTTNHNKESYIRKHAREFIAIYWLKKTDINEVVEKLTFDMI